MYKIKIFSSYCDSNHCKETFERVFKTKLIEFYGENKKYILTINDDYTHAIFLNTPMPELTIPKENVIGLAFEPYEYLGLNDNFIEYAKKHIGKYLIGSKHNLPEPFIEHFSYLFYNSPCEEIIDKPSKNIMSIVLSNKKCAPGHKYRHTLVRHIIDNNLPIDIYGRGANEYKGVNVKGEFNHIEPYNDYLFTISIENFQSNDYISEKILTPLMYNTLPLYLGAKNILNYFKEPILLTGDIIDDMNLIKSILENPIFFYKKTYNEDNIKTMNIFYKLDKLFA
jgi:hypothetical protein